MAKRKTTDEFKNELAVINSNIEVLEDYQTNCTKIKCRCKIDGYIWYPIPSNLLRGEGCPKCGRRSTAKALLKSYDQFYKELQMINPNIEIIGEYRSMHTKVKCKCKIDGYEWEKAPSEILQGKGCPLCSNKVVVAGINDIATTHPGIVMYFKNKQESKEYVSGSRKYVDFICPDCGYEKNMRVNHLVNDGFACPKCGDGVSYPNKFIRAMLDQLDVGDVSYEWSREWLIFFICKITNICIFCYFIQSNNSF